MLAFAMAVAGAPGALELGASHRQERIRNDMSLPQGTLKWFNPEKGYGFIEQECGDDVFVHYEQVQSNRFRTLEENQKVEFEFEVEQGPRGLRP
jgi:CspA family cold shock protein